MDDEKERALGILTKTLINLKDLYNLKKEQLEFLDEEINELHSAVMKLAEVISKQFYEIKVSKSQFGDIIQGRNNYIENISLDQYQAFDILGKMIFSDELLIRNIASKVLIIQYPEESLKLIQSIINSENSVYVLKHLYEHLERSKFPQHRILLKMLKERLSRLFNGFNSKNGDYLDLEEVKFVLDYYSLEEPTSCPKVDRLEIYQEDLGYSHKDIRNSDSTIEILILNHHIRAIWASLKLPKSINLLSKLKVLRITSSCPSKIQKLPETLSDLKRLKYLYIDRTELESFPDFLSKIPKLREISLHGVSMDHTPSWVLEIARKYQSCRYIKDGVQEKDAAILALLEILIGIPLINVYNEVKIEDTPRSYSYEDYVYDFFYDDHNTFYYKINEFGFVTGISIRSWEGYVELRYFPEEICELNHLEELRIKNEHYPLTLPESIEKLNKLKKLITTAKYPDSLQPFIDTLEYAHFSPTIKEYLATTGDDKSK